MPDPMASEPAEPTTRQHLVEQVARELGDLLGSDTDAFECEHFAQVLAAKGLLADPAQTTELAIARCQTSCDDDCDAPCHEGHEVLTRRHHDVAECEAGQRRWAEQTTELEELRALNRKLTLALDAARVPHEAPYVDAEHQGGNCIDVIMSEKAASHQLACENVDMQVRIATLTAEAERLRQHLSASDGAEREWHNLATNGVTASAKWKGQRDALSLLLRGMARKLVAYRKWTLGDDVPAVHRLRRELAETTADVDKFRDYLRMANNIVERRGAERDERQTRIDRALVECDREYSLGRVPLDQIPTAAQICDRIRAALVGDQPPRKPCEYVVSAWAGQEGAECIGVAEPGSDYCKPHGDALKALSGVALRDVEGRDDAAGDLP